MSFLLGLINIIERFYSKCGNTGPPLVVCFDEAQNLAVAKETFYLEGIDWEAASEGDKLLKEKHDKLSAEQYRYFVQLIEQIFEATDETTGFDKFGKGFGFNWPSWHRFLLKVVASIDSDLLADDRNCFLSSFDFPHSDVVFGVVGVDAEGECVFKSCASRKLGVAQMMTTLKYGCVPEKGQQTSHLCMNRRFRGGVRIFNPCLNSLHLVRETGAENMSRNDCINGYTFSCIHKERCIFTDIGGCFLPCINVERVDFQECQCERRDCHTAKRFLQCELFPFSF